jgi:DNA topoisomerase-1
MKQKLIIVESPSKAKTIQKYLGAGFKVMASGGHVCDLPEKTLGIDIGNNFKPEYIVNPTKQELITRLKKAVKESEITYLATDPDREGEAISWHLQNSLNIPDGENRIEFNEISQKAVKKALSTPRPINMSLVDAQQARRVLDRLVGYKLSPLLSRKIRSGLSGGRVQSVALKMIVDREREILAFVPEEYWNIYAHLNKKDSKSLVVKALLGDINGKKLKVGNKSEADKVLKEINNANWVVDKVKRGESKSSPQPPFMTSTLQQDGSQKLGITAPEVMKLAQQLYEGIDIPSEGHVAFVTYIRTDSVNVSQDMKYEALAYIKENYGAEFAPAKPNYFVTKNANAQEAHEAIRPISLERTPESVKDKLNKNQYKLYKLIYERFMASQMTDAIYNTLNVRIDANGYGFKVTGRTVAFKGYTVVYDNFKAEEDELTSNLPNLTEGEVLNLKEITPEQKFTKPPFRFTDATLVKAMEENGIGRPSTYASVITILTKREYVIKEQKFMKPTSLGETVNDFMADFFANIVDAHFTADMEEKLDKIEKGRKWQDIIADFYPNFAKELEKAGAEEKRSHAPEEKTDVICDKCGANMVIRDGRYGKFLACPAYPKCKNIKSLDKPLGPCPKCDGQITKCRTKANKIFYGCNKYPKCNFMSWDLPAPTLCPKCKGAMKIVESGASKSYVCCDRKCGSKMTVEDKD